MRILAKAAGICEIAAASELAEMTLTSTLWVAATSPPFFKVLFLIVVALVIPGFFVLMWLMSRSHKDKKKSPADKENAE